MALLSVASFAAQWDPNVAIIADIKTVVSEAVTNSIVHGYSHCEDKSKCHIYIDCKLYENGIINIRIKDKGRGIEDVETAMQPLYTTDEGGERSGMGLPIIQAFSDSMRLTSRPGLTRLRIRKKLV